MGTVTPTCVDVPWPGDTGVPAAGVPARVLGWLAGTDVGSSGFVWIVVALYSPRRIRTTDVQEPPTSLVATIQVWYRPAMGFVWLDKVSCTRSPRRNWG